MTLSIDWQPIVHIRNKDIAEIYRYFSPPRLEQLLLLHVEARFDNFRDTGRRYSSSVTHLPFTRVGFSPENLNEILSWPKAFEVDIL